MKNPRIFAIAGRLLSVSRKGSLMRRLAVAGLVFAVLQFAGTAAMADRRIALLIGNASYAGVPRLGNPAGDVALVGAALSSAGFDEVLTRTDLDRDAMVKALRAFEDDAATADIAVIYFSGHGLEMNGENFLVPVDARLAADRDVEDETVTLTRMLRTVGGARRLKLIILDACRNNPFLAGMSLARSTRSVPRGLAEIEPASSDTLVAFAAKAGTVAWDGADGSSPFAHSLARHIVEPGIDIRLALGKVRDDVLDLTGRQQEPFAYGSLGGQTVSLYRPPAVEAPAAAAQGSTRQVLVSLPDMPATAGGAQCADAAQHWFEARKFDRPDLYRKHIELFPTCAFADFARIRIEELDAIALKASEANAAEAPVPGATAAPATIVRQATAPRPARRIKSARATRSARTGKSVRVARSAQAGRPAARSTPRRIVRAAPPCGDGLRLDGRCRPVGAATPEAEAKPVFFFRPEGGGSRGGSPGGGGGGGGGGGWGG